MRSPPQDAIRLADAARERYAVYAYSRYWQRETIAGATAVVVGAGALGNEVVKNLVLLGWGRIAVVDFDRVEAANLTRSVFFRPSDVGSGIPKAVALAVRAGELNPDARIRPVCADVNGGLGLGWLCQADVVLGCLDNRLARLAINAMAQRAQTPWVDGAIAELDGSVAVYLPGQGACYRCTLGRADWQQISHRRSCAWKEHQAWQLGKVATTPTIASVIGAMQVQEALKLLHGLPVQPGTKLHFLGAVNEADRTVYARRPDCVAHEAWGDVVELPLGSAHATLHDLLSAAAPHLPGTPAELCLTRDAIAALTCPGCGRRISLRPPRRVLAAGADRCPDCRLELQSPELLPVLAASDYGAFTLRELGVPLWDVVQVADDAGNTRAFELAGDRPW